MLTQEELLKKYKAVIYGYPDTHYSLKILRLNGIKYEYLYDTDVYYKDMVVVGIPRPEEKWQRKILDNFLFQFQWKLTHQKSRYKE